MDEPTVAINYTVKEIVSRIDLKIDNLSEKLDTKIGSLEQKLDTKVDETEFIPLRRDVDDLKAFKWKVYGALTAIGAAVSAGAVHIFVS